ncbi:hypothetical protein WJX84_008499 [Apatococcus fuscideae]|uniref:DUF7912 domain-containing protein n=1 Tax=Apatococcus fuscideae TaxID=2026836 RepID=A0AAW1SSX0_9CHLO
MAVLGMKMPYGLLGRSHSDLSGRLRRGRKCPCEPHLTAWAARSVAQKHAGARTTKSPQRPVAEQPDSDEDSENSAEFDSYGIEESTEDGKDVDFREGSIQLEELDAEDSLFESDDEALEAQLQGSGVAAFIDHGNMPWALAALNATQAVLASQPHLQLYLFRAIAKGTRLDIRLDKPEDPYGSPSMEDTETFLRALTTELEASIGSEETENIDIEVSSPGVERVVRIPGELERFKDVPMTLEFELDTGRLDTRILQYVGCDSEAGLTTWKLADVKRNRMGKGRPQLSRKQAELRFDIKLQHLTKARLFLDM